MATQTVLNIMLGRGKGGIEQAAIDYAEAMRSAGIACITVTQPDAFVNAMLSERALPYQTLRCFSPWDILAACRLRRIAGALQASRLITHGNRALSIARLAAKGQKRMKITAVAHNYKLKRFTRQIDSAFSTTSDLAEQIRILNPSIDISIIPNATPLPGEHVRHAFRSPVVIGTMGRFVAKKGFDIYIEALALLKSRGLAFDAILGGDGEEKGTLTALAHRHGLGEQLRFTGWVQDKQAFWNSIDIFVLPSHHEPFGIVLIEAMAQSLPCIATASEGPREILTGGIGALTPLNDVEALANAIASYIAYPETALAHGRAARARVAAEYTIVAMGERIKAALGQTA